MKRNTGPAPLPGVTIEDDGLSVRGFAMLALSAGTLILSIAIAVAIWRISAGIKWALILLASGSAAEMAFVGLGIYRRHELAGRAQLVEAQGRADEARARGQAQVLAARLSHALPERGGR